MPLLEWSDYQLITYRIGEINNKACIKNDTQLCLISIQNPTFAKSYKDHEHCSNFNRR